MTATGDTGNARQRRRGKKETTLSSNNNNDDHNNRGQQASTGSVAPPLSSSSNSTTISLREQIERAVAAVRANEARVRLLQEQWKTYLLWLSYLMIVVSLHQAHGPMAQCARDIQAWNGFCTNPTTASGHVAFPAWKASLLILADSFVYVLAIIMSVAISLFLGQVVKDLSKPPSGSARTWHMIANGCLPATLALYHLRPKFVLASSSSLSKPVPDGGDEIQSSCIAPWLEKAQLTMAPADVLRYRLLPDEDISNVRIKQQSFPVVVVFYAIATTCLWYMQKQMQQQKQNLEAVLKLELDLGQADEVRQQQQHQQHDQVGPRL